MLPEINDILFATDLSENADNALRYAMALGVSHGAKVHVLHVTEPLSQDAIVTLRMFMQNDEARDKAIRERHDSVKQMLKANQKAFVKRLSPESREAYKSIVSVELVDGHPAEEIMERAKALNCQLVVMGTHEQGTGHTFLGTVTKRVLRRSPIPTLVVPHVA